jgi:Tfp pilus assembly protein PilF
MKIRGRKKRKELAMAIDQGREFLLSGRHEENFEFLQEAVQRFPEDPEIRLLYATVLLEDRPDCVAQEASKAAELGPDNPRILVRAAQLLFDRGEVKTARACVARANGLAPPGFVLKSGLINLNGLIAAFDGEHDLAEERLRAALECEPSNGPFAVDLARYLVSRDRRSEAVEIIDQTLTHTSQRENLERVRDEIVRD